MVELVQGDHGELLRGDGLAEVKADVVHQEGLQFSLEPQCRLGGRHVGVEGAQNGFFGDGYGWNEAESFHINAYTDPVEELVVNVVRVFDDLHLNVPHFLSIILINFSLLSKHSCFRVSSIFFMCIVDFGQVYSEVCPELFHVEFKVVGEGHAM